MKKKVMILLSVVLVIATGCGNKSLEVSTSSESSEAVDETEEVTEAETVTESVQEETEITETDNEETLNDQTVNESSESNASKQTENKTQNNNSSHSAEQQQTEAPQTEKVSEPEPEAKPVEETQVISYSPQNVVALATAKTKAAGKILLTDNLDNLLASGQISQEEYNEYYPYDGAGYYSVFVDTNMAEARSVSGTTSFHSEDEIAQYIADMLVLENGPYFLIEYAGTYDYYGKQCYEFRCYRA